MGGGNGTQPPTARQGSGSQRAKALQLFLLLLFGRYTPRGPGRKARLERRQERRQSSGFARFVGFETEIFDSNKRFCWLKRPPWADVLDTCIRRVATGPNTGRRLAWHSVNSMGAEYFRQRAKDSGRSLIWRQEIVAHVDQTWSANLSLRRSWSSGE